MGSAAPGVLSVFASETAAGLLELSLGAEVFGASLGDAGLDSAAAAVCVLGMLLGIAGFRAAGCGSGV